MEWATGNKMFISIQKSNSVNWTKFVKHTDQVLFDKKYEKKDFKNKKYYYCFCDGSTDSAKIQKN